MAAVWLLVLYFAFPVFLSGQASLVFSWSWSPPDGEFGILPMLSASLMLSFSALCLAWPLAVGLACRLQLNNHRNSNYLLAFIRFMTTIPTVVYGFASVFLLIPLVREARGSGSGLCWLSAMLVLALLILPTMILVLDTALRSIHKRTSLSMAALGFSPEQSLTYLVLPASRRWLASSAVLGFGRAIGDTLIPLMLSGNAPQVPDSLFTSIRTLSAHMALVTATEAGGPAYNSLFIAAGLLLLISVSVSLSLRRIAHERHGAFLSPPLTLPAWSPSLLRFWAYLSTNFVLGAVCLLGLFLLYKGIPALGAKLFFGDTPPIVAITGSMPVWDGIWPACVGTISLLLLTMTLALVPGVCCGVYLAEYASVRTKALLSLIVDAMAGMPSIVMGTFGFLLLLLLKSTIWAEAQPGLLLAALCLALLTLPVIIMATRNALESLPSGLRLSAHALGFSHTQLLHRILLPQASSGILSGVVLAMGRAAEDTAVIILTGAVATAGMPSGLGMRFEALPFTIYYTAAQYQDADELARGFGASLILLGLSCSLLLFAQHVQQRYSTKYEKGHTA